MPELRDIRTAEQAFSDTRRQVISDFKCPLENMGYIILYFDNTFSN